MSHNIIFLFSHEGVAERNKKRFIQNLREFRITPPVKLFYLEISTGREIKFTDKFIQVTSGQPLNNLNVELQDLNLRSYADLKKCFDIINRESPAGSTNYLVSTGHGKGFGTARLLFSFLDDVKSTFDRVPGWVNHMLDSDFWNAHQKQMAAEILWNIELKEALKEFPLELAIFNNCNINFFDSLFFYSDVCKYLIGTENYLNTQMLQLDRVLKGIEDHAGKDPRELAEELYKISLKGFLAAGNILHMKKASLFLIDLSKMPELLKLFNDMIYYVQKTFSNDLAWYDDLVDSLQQFYVGRNFDLIDLAVFLDGLSQKLNDTALSKMTAVIIDKIKHELVLQKKAPGQDNDRFGVSIYLPPVEEDDSYYSSIFTEYSTNYKNYLTKFQWYSLVNDFGIRLGKVPPLILP